MKVKMCGITNEEDLGKAVYYGAWAVGFVFDKKSPRYVSPSRAKLLVQLLPPFVTPVGVFVNQREKAVKDVCRFTKIHTVQFHGEETKAYCKRFVGYKIIKAFRVGDAFNFNRIQKYAVDAYLFDAYVEGVPGGTGQTFNWNMLKDLQLDKPFMLSGGLNPENIGDALDIVSPYAVDVSSGLEKSPGIKNPRLIRAFFDVLKKR